MSTQSPGQQDQIESPEPTASAQPTAHGPVTHGAPDKRSLFTDPLPWIMLAAALGLDQLTKAIVRGQLRVGESWPEEGFFRVTHAWNTGTAFSLLQDQSTLLTVISFAAVIALYFVYRSVDSPTIWVRMAFGLLLGGAIGNLVDRLRLGHVTDFADIGPWPIFNIADSSIIVGIFVLFLFFWFNADEKKKDQAKPQSPVAPLQGQSSGGSIGSEAGNQQENG